jgi:saccharopine dehydrogenase-like NADP-dependent oxidoreductase
MLNRIERLIQMEEDPMENVQSDLKKFLLVDEHGELETIGIEEIKQKAARTVAWQKHEASLIITQLLFLGIRDDETIINKGRCSAADVLQFALETKLLLHPGDRDMIVMLHELEYELGGINYSGSASLIVKGENNIHTAMAKTVGLPLAAAASLFLQGKLPVRGLQIPVIPDIYQPVLTALAENGISFVERHMEV